MIEGPSGIRAISRDDVPRYEPTRRRLVWRTARWRMAFSAEDADSLRGPQFDAAWCDEAAKWKNGEAVFDMLQFGLRLGERPRLMVTSTPKPVPLIRRLIADDGFDVTHHADRRQRGEPRAPASWKRCTGSTAAPGSAGRNSSGELIEERDDALWSRAMLEAASARRPAELARIVVAVDPPASSRSSSDACGIVAAGLDAGRHGLRAGRRHACGAPAAGLGRPRGGALPRASRPTAWSPRSTRAATW